MGTLTNREISNIMENSTEGLRRLKFGARQASGVYVVLPRPPAHFTPNNILHRPLFFFFFVIIGFRVRAMGIC